MSHRNGGEVRLLRHEPDGPGRSAALALRPRLGRGARFGTVRFAPMGGKLRTAIERLLDVLAREETAAVFVLDGAEHLTARQISALRRRVSRPDKFSHLAAGALRNAWPDAPPNDKTKTEPEGNRCPRYRIKAVAPYLVDLRPLKGEPANRPLLEHIALPRSEIAEAEGLSVALLTLRFGQTEPGESGAMPLSLLCALLDLLTILGRGATAHMLVLDRVHLADAADPRALDRYSRPALSLAALSPRTIHKHRVIAGQRTRARQSPKPPSRIRPRHAGRIRVPDFEASEPESEGG